MSLQGEVLVYATFFTALLFVELLWVDIFKNPLQVRSIISQNQILYI